MYIILSILNRFNLLNFNTSFLWPQRNEAERNSRRRFHSHENCIIQQSSLTTRDFVYFLMFQNHSNCLELFGISQKRGFAQSYGLDTTCRHPTENSQIRYKVSFMFSCLLCCFQQQLPNKLYIIKFDLNVMNHHCFILLIVEVFEWIY